MCRSANDPRGPYRCPSRVKADAARAAAKATKQAESDRKAQDKQRLQQVQADLDAALAKKQAVEVPADVVEELEGLSTAPQSLPSEEELVEVLTGSGAHPAAPRRVESESRPRRADAGPVSTVGGPQGGAVPSPQSNRSAGGSAKMSLAQVRASYLDERRWMIQHPETLVHIEEQLSDVVAELMAGKGEHLKRDFDAASDMSMFWGGAPPEARGHKPRGDQHPWSEVGEQTTGPTLTSALSERFVTQSRGFPMGSDQRIVLSGEEIEQITGGRYKEIWLHADIKTAGPTDDKGEVVVSPYQVTGSGDWEEDSPHTLNSPMHTVGTRKDHPFHASLAPLTVDPKTGLIAPVVTLVLKPTYLVDSEGDQWVGQPLERLDLVTIPNGLLLTKNPNYLAQHPTLLRPGKDDSTVAAARRRARVNFEVLSEIAAWRVREIWRNTEDRADT